MIRLALVVILLLGGAFAYREATKPSLHDQAVASLKRNVAETGLGDPSSVSCNSKPSPIPAGFAAYGNVTMFDCSFADPSTGTVHGMCMMHGEAVSSLERMGTGWRRNMRLVGQAVRGSELGHPAQPARQLADADHSVARLHPRRLPADLGGDPSQILLDDAGVVLGVCQPDREHAAVGK